MADVWRRCSACKQDIALGGAYYTCSNNVGTDPSCIDINECAVNNGACGVYATCQNNTGAAQDCLDIDE